MSNMYDKYTFDRNAAALAIALINRKRQASALKSSQIDEEKEPRPPWREWFLSSIGVTTMEEPTQPFRFWNPTMVSAWCAVLALIFILIGGLMTVAFYVGMQYKQSQAIEKRLEVAEEKEQKRLLIEASKKPQTGHEEDEKK